MRAENGQARSLGSVRAVVGRLRARHAEIARAIYDRIREAVPDSVGARDAAYQAGVIAAVDAVLSYSFDVIEHGTGWSGPIPPEAVAQARRAARAGVSQGVVVRRYLAGHARLGELVAEEIARIGLARNAPALLEISRTQEKLLQYLTAAIEHEHNQEHQRIARSPQQRRAELVRRLLDGDAGDPAEAAELHYNLDASWHLGLIATGANAEYALRELSVCPGHKLLLVSCDNDTVWAWLGGLHKLAVTDIEQLLSTTRLAAVSLAVGEPARGIEGWRQTHRSATAAHLVARCRRHGLTRYLDVALEATLLQDEALAAVLVDGYLSPLDDDRGGGPARRRTLRAIFDAEHNLSSAASILKVDRRTVHRWRGEIEQRLGYRLHEHQAEIEIALRLAELRGDRRANGSPLTRSD